MIKRTLVVQSQAYLHVRHRQMVVAIDTEDHVIPIEDLGVLLIENPAVTLSAALIGLCAEHGVAVVVCDDKHLPTIQMWPLTGNSLHQAVLGLQISVSEPVKKRAWQQIVRAKLRNQASVLRKLGKPTTTLDRLMKEVRSGDPANVEATAARAYWRTLLGQEFRRKNECDSRNAALNYGYAVVRAITARALVASGFHPAIGLKHHNQYDPFCLADDLMEPLRPAVDLVVSSMTPDPNSEPLDKETRRRLLEVLSKKVLLETERVELWPALSRYCASLRRVLSREQRLLEIPEL